MNLDLNVLKAIGSDAATALAAVAEKYGVQIDVGGISIEMDVISSTTDIATMKVQISAIAADGTAKTKEATDFERNAVRYGLQPSDLGREFPCEGVDWVIVGAKPRSTKYPLLVQSPNGNIFYMSVDLVKLGLQQAA